MSNSTRRLAALMSLSCAVSMLTACTQTNKSVTKTQAAAQPKMVKFYKLDDLDYKTADHSTPDALVYISPEYDASKPINLVIYNHGMMTNLNVVEETFHIADGMKNAAPNTVLVAPEWATVPYALSANAGDFHKPGFFRNMLTEIFSKTPELKNRSIDRDVNSIALTSFSGGLYALSSELERNGMGDKVKTVALFDSLYKHGVLEGWLKSNIKQLASGEKQFYNFYFHTYPRSNVQAKLVKNLLASNGLESNKILRFDTGDPNTIMSAEKIASKPIIFKYSINGDEKLSGHNAVPLYYIPQFIKAMNLRQQGDAQIASKNSTKPM